MEPKSSVLAVWAALVLVVGCSGSGEEPAAAVSSTSAGLSGPLYGLLSMEEDRNTRVSSIQANNGWVTAYERTLSVSAGEVLRIRGQAEFTNDNSLPVRGHIQVLVNGSQAGVATGEYYSQNVTPSSHHVPLFVDALYVAPGSQVATVSVQIAASRTGSSPWMKVEHGYGHLVIERYRSFASVQEAASAGALRLADVGKDRDTTVTSFGVNAPYSPVTLYSTSLWAQAGDLMRLFGQSTSQWNGRTVNGSTFDMHGHALYQGSGTLSPYSTENTPWDVQYVPLWSDAVSRISTSGTYTYDVRAHGVNGVGALVTDHGHVYAMRFSPFSSATAGGYALVDARVQRSTATGVGVQANSGYQVLAQSSIAAPGRSWLRATGAVQLAHPSGFPSGVSCNLELSTQATSTSGSSTVLEQAYAVKYTTPSTEVTPLRTELLTELPSSGPYRVVLRVACSRWDGSPIVGILDNRTLIATELYTQL